MGHQFFDSREHNENSKFQPDPKIKRIRANVSVDDRPVAETSQRKDAKSAAKKGSTFSVAHSGANVSQSPDAQNAAASASATGMGEGGPMETQMSQDLSKLPAELAQKKIKQRNMHRRN